MTKGNKYKCLVGLPLKQKIAVQKSLNNQGGKILKKRKRRTSTNRSEEPVSKKKSLQENGEPKPKSGKVPPKPKDDGSPAAKKKRVHRGCYKKADSKTPKKRKPRIKKNKKGTEADGKESSLSQHSTTSTNKLRDKLIQKLQASKFRHINEQLYKCSGEEAQAMFKDDPDLFTKYHQGFTKQAQCWPINPLDIIIRDLKKCNGNLRIADMGCGEARLATTLTQCKVKSFDLVAVNPNVTACDMSKTPLKSAKMDVVVFCLSLMGTNVHEYLVEANRILKIGGALKIAEIANRIPHVKKWHRTMEKLGFALTNERQPNDMFVIFDYEKRTEPKGITNTEALKLQPCLYKKR